MEEAPGNEYRFRDAVSPMFAALAFTLIAGTTATNLVGIISDEQRAAQAEHVVELLHEAHSPESVIADQQAEAARFHADVEWGWYFLSGLAAAEILAIVGGVAIAAAHDRRQQDRNGT